MKQVIRITEGELKRIINESVETILAELDWRTYAEAGEKAQRLADQDKNVGYEAKRRSNQAKAFRQASNDRATTQYGLDNADAKIQKGEGDFTQGELKNLARRDTDVKNYYQGKQEYKGGKWQNKEE